MGSCCSRSPVWRSQQVDADNGLVPQREFRETRRSEWAHQRDDESAPIVAEICLKLDGIPLAIELAAARVETFGVRGLATHLDDRFRLLTSGRRSGPPRHRTLRAALDWSYEVLSERPRTNTATGECPMTTRPRRS
jgi:hypothetical protein